MNIREAKLNGIRAASEAHHNLGINRYIAEGLELVDVFDALAELDVFTLCRPLDGILGAYTNTDGAGILVTTNRRIPIQRFTAAHELGHYWLKHDESIDSEKSVGLARAGMAGVGLQEIEAETFASEFLLPKSLLIKNAIKHSWNKKDLQNPDTVYQLSLRTATSYEATWRALLENRLITPAAAENIKSMAPKQAKLKALADVAADNSWAEVYHLEKYDTGSCVLASPDDTVLIDLQEHVSSGYLWTDIDSDNFEIEVLSDKKNSGLESQVGSVGARKIYFRGEGKVSIHMEERRPWQKDGESINNFDVEIDFYGKEVGLPRAVRQ